MKIVLILFIGGVNYAMLTTALVLDLLDQLVDNQLYLGIPQSFNTTYADCVWREPFKDRTFCSKEVQIWLTSNGIEELIDVTNRNWLKNSTLWDDKKENVFFVHGYAAGDRSQVTLFFRDAFIENNSYNFFMIDYGAVSRAPCYIQLVQNIKYVSYCLASYLKDFVENGMQKNVITCIGHSMGAHICGMLRRYSKIRIKKIIALDPALPLITNPIRLSPRDALVVHTIQTNAGYYGDLGSIGHLDICVNNGIMQPYCANTEVPHLCSHMFSLCYMAHSLFDQNPQLQAKPCTDVCPHLPIYRMAKAYIPYHRTGSINGSISSPGSVLLGMNIPDRARGSYCLSAVERPFCPSSRNKIGISRCCDLQSLFDPNFIPIQK